MLKLPPIRHACNFDADEYDVKVAETKRETTKLLEAGFEWVGRDKDCLTYLRKRK